MTNGYITVIHPEQVAREVERQVKLGCRSFLLHPVARGGMLDQERLGAARYAAGLHAVVELESLANVSAAAR
jgi:predicted TIM-barrel fold metal-dependent hydrolase